MQGHGSYWATSATDTARLIDNRQRPVGDIVVYENIGGRDNPNPNPRADISKCGQIRSIDVAQLTHMTKDYLSINSRGIMGILVTRW